jgi:SAM-dependent methyltransferase
MSEPTSHAEFAEHSYSWEYIERPALDRAIDRDYYDQEEGYDLSVLDVGCGGGRIIGYHLDRGAYLSEIVGIDANTQSLEIARDRYPGVSFEEETIQGLDIGENTLDLVTAVLSLRYLNNVELSEFMQKISKGLKPGGLFVALDVHPARQVLTDDIDKSYDEGRRLVNTPWGTTENYYFKNLGTYVTAAAEEGLTIEGAG